ncbi:response regulator transcription factor [Rahnella sp. FC061912-K]|uniref:helix-turn-helix transcriptional regulator n=1 Tax=Rahnella rivi TaxID=2816249 RepID=UPI001C27182A|nr:LuxR C-terminal-related transcriptional regulator [Rahnella rivi]MBU9828518.1 response regulator transcription factor [Rahnella rivi]
MTRKLKILIVDTDQFFVAGLQQAIRKYFNARNTEVLFLSLPLQYPLADLIFWASYCPNKVMPMGLLENRKVIQLKSQEMPNLVTDNMALVFYRHQCDNSLSSLLDQVMHTTLDRHAETESEENQENPFFALTPRQWEVIGYISSGMSLYEISKRLRIDRKTVSSHKRAAMRNLQLNSITDLHKWLLSNGMIGNNL